MSFAMGCVPSVGNRLSSEQPDERQSRPPDVTLTKVESLQNGDVVSQQTITGHGRENGLKLSNTSQPLATWWEDVSQERFKNEHGETFFSEFPTPTLLAEAQLMYTSLNYEAPAENGIKLPFPTPSLKQDLFKFDEYAYIDDHVTKVPMASCFDDLNNLVAKLLKPAKDDIGRVRAIYRWIATKDVSLMSFTQMENPKSAARFLSQIKANKGGYPELFQHMCSRAKIPCRIVPGFVKGFKYEPGGDVTQRVGAWSAVYVSNSWRLVDCNWGASHMSSADSHEWTARSGSTSQNSDGMTCSKMSYGYEEFYFLTDPQHLIYSHCPSDEKWQLLARPVSLEEFKNMAYLKPTFFESGFDLSSHSKCVIDANNGQCLITLRLPTSGAHRFIYRLYRSQKTGTTTSVENIGLERYVFLDMARDASLLRAKISLPCEGTYKFKLFSKDITISETSFSSICSYIIHCDKSPTGPITPYPPNAKCEWGPGADMQLFGIVPLSHTSGLIEAEDAEVEVTFTLNQDVQFLHKLLHKGREESAYRDFVFHRFEDNRVIFQVRLPEPGRYTFSIFAKKSEAEGPFPNVCNYLIECKEASSTTLPFPEIYNGQVGPNRNFQELGLTLLGNDSGFFQCRESGELALKFKFKHPFSFLPKLRLQIGGGYKDFSDYAKCTVEGDVVTFYLVFPEPGMYHLTLFAREYSSSESYPSIYNGLIQADFPKVGAIPFPRVFSNWKDSYQMLEPTVAYLPTNERIRFLAKIPDAKGVAIIGNTWVHLQQNDKQLWDGILETGDMECDLKFSASVSPEKDKYACLQLFKVVSKQTLKNTTEKQKDLFDKSQERFKANQRRQEERDIAKGRRTKDDIQNKRQADDELRRREKEKIKDDIKQQQEDDRRRQEERRKEEEEFMNKVAAELLRNKVAEEQERQKKEEEAECLIEEEENKRIQERVKIEEEKELQKMEKCLGAAVRHAAVSALTLTEANSSATKEELAKQKKNAESNAVRAKLRQAIKEGGRTSLEAAIAEFKTIGAKQVNGELDEAQAVCDLLVLKAAMFSAMESKDMAALKRTIARIEERGFSAKLQEDLVQGRDKLRTLERIQKLKSSILSMDAKTMTELRRYNNPPEAVHKVMIATLLLLGEHEGITKKWIRCQKRCNPTGPEGLKRRVLDFDVDRLNAEIAARAGEILSELDLDQVSLISSGAATFYVWVKGMVEEVRQKLEDSEQNPAQPAKKSKQKLIFLGRSDVHDDDDDDIGGVSRPVTRAGVSRPTTSRSVYRRRQSTVSGGS